MRIVHLAENLEVGGAEKLITLLCRWQREQGHEASVHCLYSLGPLGKELRREAFEVLVHDAAGIGGRPASVYRRIKERKPDVVHCHNATAAILGAPPARAAGAKTVIVTRHGIVSPPYLMRREIKFAAASRFCDWIVAVCDQARRNLTRAPFAASNKIVRIYNGAHAPHVNGSPFPTKSGFTLLHVGRLSPAKDQQTLLRAFAVAKNKIPDLQLWMVGGGSLRAKLEAVARETGTSGSVTFFGEQADVAPFFAAADAFVLSSISEGVPVSLLEALASSLPAIVTEVGGMSEVARLSDATMTAPPSDPEALALAIEKMANARDRFAYLRRSAQECYLANFTLDRMGREYLALYDSE